MSLVLTALVTATVHAACPADVADPGALAIAALATYEQLEVERFQGQVQELHASLPCLEAPIDPQAAAQLHLVTALEAWTRRDEDQVHSALRTLLDLQPGYRPGVVIAPEGGGLAAAFEAARAAGPGAAGPYPGLSLYVDGQPDAALPSERAALVQWAGASGFESHYAWPGQLDSELRRAARLSGGTVPSAPLPSSHRSRNLAIAAAATAVVALVGTRQANDAWSDFQATDSWPDAQRYYTRNRVFAVGSGLAAAGTAGLAVGAVVVWEW